MMGRASYHDAGQLGQVDRRIFGEEVADLDAADGVRAYLPYVSAQLETGVPLAHMTRHMLGLFHGRMGARTWRRILTVEGSKAGAGIEVILEGLEAVEQTSKALTQPSPTGRGLIRSSPFPP
jgi:tRNA-dihydrouridine synthase A